MANDDRAQLASAGGVGTSISDSALSRLPTLNRDVYDFVRLVPHLIKSKPFDLVTPGISLFELRPSLIGKDYRGLDLSRRN
jgi:hypothetical protein